MRILLVDDDEALMESLAENLIQQRYAVDIATDGSSAQSYLDLFNYDLLVLDLMLPDGDGIEFCQVFRKAGYTNPLMILTAKESSAEKIKALDAGADDYVVKPFDFGEVCARIRALLRRDPQGLPPILRWGPLTLDPSTYETTYAQQSVRLTPKEFSMMELFLRNPHRVYSLGSIIDDLWSFEDPPGEDAVRTHIKGLRRKLQAAGAPKDLIKTVYGLGYRLNENVGWLSPDESETELSEQNSAAARESPIQNLATKQIAPTRASEAAQKVAVNASATSELESNSDAIAQPAISHATDQRRSVASQLTADPSFAFDNPLNPLLSCPLDGRYAQTGTQAIAAASRRYLLAANEQVSVLEAAARALEQGALDPTLQATSQMNAHKLAGSLGSFGIREGSRVARQIETQLRAIALFPPQLSPQASSGIDAGKQDHKKNPKNTPEPSPEVLTTVSPAEIAQLVTQLRQLVDTASVRATSEAMSAAVREGMPRLLIISRDEVLARQLVRAATALNLQIQVAITLEQARHLLTRAVPETAATDLWMPDLLLLDMPLDVTPFSAFIEEVKQSYDLPVVVVEEKLTLSTRLSLVEQGIALISDRRASPPQIIESALGVLKAKTRQIQVAIADDDPQILALLEASLEPWGFSITTFDSAHSLWQWLTADSSDQPAAHQPAETELSKADILVLDIEMPEMTGIELCQVIRSDSRFQTLPILFLTIHQEEDLRMKAFRAGADDFMDKAVAPAELATRLRNQLTRACRLHTFGNLSQDV
ncbi:MAG: response regulator [Phormidesmis sp.]